MNILTTPMCQEILRLAGVSEFKINEFKLDQYGSKNHDHPRVDLAVVLSETEINPHMATHFLKIKLNTFSQIKESIKIISDMLGTEPVDYILPSHHHRDRNENGKIKVKVHSNFLREIVEDMGFMVMDDGDYDFLVYPDYLKDKIKGEIDSAGERAIEIPSHKKAPLDPIKRAEMRYEILEKSLCMKR